MNQYRVAVCDDDAVILERICSLCEEIFTEEGICHEITAFSSPKDLKEQLDSQCDFFNLLILDIKMEEMTGMELAYSLRDAGNRVSIIFITAYDEYLAEGYGVQPIHFLMKPVKKEALANALLTDVKLNYLPKTVLLPIGKKTVSLFWWDIRYMESSNHSVVIYREGTTQNGSVSISLSELERRLPPGQFGRCHNSYLVNLAYVQEIGRTSLYLRGHEKIPVGRAYYKAFQQMFIRYCNK